MHLRDVIAVEIENLDPVIVAVADQKPVARVNGKRVRPVELARPGNEPSPLLDKLACPVEFEDAVIACAMALGDEDVAEPIDLAIRPYARGYGWRLVNTAKNEKAVLAGGPENANLGLRDD